MSLERKSLDNYHKPDAYHLGMTKIKWDELLFKWYAQGKIIMSCIIIGSEHFWKGISLKRGAPCTDSCSDSEKVNDFRYLGDVFLRVVWHNGPKTIMGLYRIFY